MAGNSAMRAAAPLSLAPAAFFTYYTLRLIYVNIAVAGVAEHRQAGMYIGFVAFPAFAVLFGTIAYRLWRNANRR